MAETKDVAAIGITAILEIKAVAVTVAVVVMMARQWR